MKEDILKPENNIVSTKRNRENSQIETIKSDKKSRNIELANLKTGKRTREKLDSESEPPSKQGKVALEADLELVKAEQIRLQLLLVNAVKKKQYENIEKLLKQGALPNTPNMGKVIPLVLAQKLNDQKAINILEAALYKPTKIPAHSDHNTCLLIETINKKKLEQSQALSKSLNLLKETNVSMVIPIELVLDYPVSETINVEKVDVLLAILNNDITTLKEYVNQTKPEGLKITHCNRKLTLLVKDQYSSIHNQLLTYDFNKTPLILLASMLNHVDMVQLLAMHTPKEQQVYALQFAAKNGISVAIQALLHVELDINLPNKENKTALIIATEKNSLKVIQMLLQHKDIKVDTVDNHKMTALLYACQNGYEYAVRLLLDNKLHTKEHIQQGLEFACAAAHIKIADFLLTKGADVNKDIGDKWSMLMSASLQNNPAIVKFLLEKGADVTKVDASGKTARAYAFEYKHLETLEVILIHQFKLSQDLAKYINVAKEFVTEPITLELSKASNSKYIAGMSAVISNAEENHFGKYLGKLLNVIKQNQKELTEMFARWKTLNKTDKFAFHKLVQGELTEKQCEAFADEKPELYKFGQDVLNLVGKDTPKVLKFVSNFIKLNQQKMLPYKEMILSILCLDKLNTMYYKGELEFSEMAVFNIMVGLSKNNIVAKYSEFNRKTVKEFIIDFVYSETVLQWLLNDFMKGVAAQTELIAEDIAPAELVPAAEIVEPEALEVAGDLPEDAEAGA